MARLDLIKILIQENTYELTSGLRLCNSVWHRLNFSDGTEIPTADTILLDLFRAVPREVNITVKGIPAGVQAVVTKMKPSRTWRELSLDDVEQLGLWLKEEQIFIVGSFLTMAAHDCTQIVSLIMTDASSRHKVARCDKFNFKEV